MARTKHYRRRGTGSICNPGKQFYFKIRINGRTKSCLSRNQEDKPVTTRQDAEKAAVLLEIVLFKEKTGETHILQRSLLNKKTSDRRITKRGS